MTNAKTPTHIAYAMKREGKRHMRPLEVGIGHMDSDGVFHGYLDRVPIGGFNGYVYFAPIGAQPPSAEPERPRDALEGEDV